MEFWEVIKYLNLESPSESPRLNWASTPDAVNNYLREQLEIEIKPYLEMIT